MNQLEQIRYLKYNWPSLHHYDNLTVEQIKLLDNDCERMYLYFYYNHPNFYNYKKKKLLNRYINKKKDNLLIFAAALGKLDALKYLVLNGLDINYKNKHNVNAYIIAAQFGQIEILKYLDTTTIDKNIKDTNGNNAYLCAAYGGHINVLKYLKNKFDIYCKNIAGINAYCMAAIANHINAMKYLESLNFNIYEKNNDGYNIYESYCAPYSLVCEYLENKFLYLDHSKICSICHEIKNDKFITCKNNHIVHLKCQQKNDRNRCLMCSFRYVI
jgi:ankyrin repeat protein